MMFLDLSALEVMTFLSNYVSVDHLAANTVLINLFYVSIVFSYGVQQSVGPLIGQAVGANHIRKAKRYGLIGWVTGVTFGLLCCIVILSIPRKVFSIYTKEPQVLDIMEGAGPFVCLCILLDHSQICLSGIIVGLGKQR